MHAAKFDIPVIKVEDLPKADGFIFGFPTRFGRAPAQVYTFWDATSSLWYKGELSGKYAGLFTSTATQHGGQETTPFTFIPTLAHHGLLYVPFGYTSGLLNDNSEIMGGSPWGASTIANGDGSRQPSVKELAIAKAQGSHFAGLINRLKD